MKLSTDNLKQWMKKDRLLILLLLGILMLILVIPTPSKKTQEQTKKSTVQTTTQQEEQQIYVEKLEEQLQKTLEQVEGVGTVKVMITLKSTKENVVLEDEQKNNSDITEEDSGGGTRQTKQIQESSTAVYDQADGENTPYVIKENMPAVEGVVVIAEGGGNSVVVSNISEAVKALFGVEAHKIKVMKMNS